MSSGIATRPPLPSKRLDFEILISDLSARFVNLPLGEVDREVREALGRVRRFFDADRCGLIKVLHEGWDLRITHYCLAEGPPPVAINDNYLLHYPWTAKRLLQDRQAVNIHVRDFPPEADIDRASAEAAGTRTLLVIPLMFEGAVRYLIALNVVREERAWPADYIPRLRLVGEIMMNALMREEAERFEALLSGISGRFINLPSERMDEEILEELARLCEGLGVDRSTLWQLSSEDPPVLRLTHVHQPPDAPQATGTLRADELFPWLFRRILLGETVILSKMEDLPPEAATDRENFARYDARSSAVFPLQAGGKVVGALSFAAIRKERDWPGHLVVRMKILAEAFANLLERHRGERALRERGDLLRSIFSSMNDKMALLDNEGRVVLVNMPMLASPREEHREILNPARGGNFLESCRRRAAEGDAGAAAILDGIRSVAEGSLERFSTEYPKGPSNGSSCFLVSVNRWQPDRGVVVGFHDVTELKIVHGELRKALDDVTRLQEQLERENLYLRQELSSHLSPKGIIGQSVKMRHVLSQARLVAATGSVVLLLGETGTGKGRIASSIHEMSPRRDRTMVNVNCAAIPETLIESELFGREKGAYTGAYAKKAGSFEFANGSTIFLDEVGELPSEAQAKLLRVLEEKKINRLGSPRDIEVDVRIIAASNRDLGKAVREGKFRSDLYYRLNVFSIMVPPLREHREDIAILVEVFAREFGDAMGKSFRSVSRTDMEKLTRYSWPGNIRELRNVIERAAILSPGPTLRVEVPASDDHARPDVLTMADAEKEHIRCALESTGWQVAGRGGAAELLGMKPSTLRSRMEKLGLLRAGRPHEPSR